jgi:hypothetical protein
MERQWRRRDKLGQENEADETADSSLEFDDAQCRRSQPER